VSKLAGKGCGSRKPCGTKKPEKKAKGTKAKKKK
jgi:hypothetical protein